jgi:hypothetical protein
MKIFWLIWGTFFAYKTWAYRVGIYKKMLALIQDNDIGFCRALEMVEPVDVWYDKLWKFPELYWYKPRQMEWGRYWFRKDEEGMNKRREILRKIIDEYDKSEEIEEDYDPYYKY